MLIRLYAVNPFLKTMSMEPKENECTKGFRNSSYLIVHQCIHAGDHISASQALPASPTTITSTVESDPLNVLGVGRPLQAVLSSAPISTSTKAKEQRCAPSLQESSKAVPASLPTYTSSQETEPGVPQMWKELHPESNPGHHL